MSKMTFTEKNDFIVKHSTDNPEHFKRDFELFQKVFPASPLNNDLQRVQPFNRKALNERMLLELLNYVCGTAVLENRGIFSKAAVQQKTLDDKGEAQHRVLNTEDLDSLTQPELRKLVTDLELKTDDFKKATLVPVLEAYRSTLTDDAPPPADDDDKKGDNAPPADDEGNKGDDTPPSATDECDGNDADKKKETPEQNTPE